MNKEIIHTPQAPEAIGCYSQAVKTGTMLFLSGQIALDPATMQMQTDIDAQIHQVLQNLSAVCAAAGASLNDIVKLTVYLTDLSHFAKVNDSMAVFFKAPYPARAAVGVAALPRGAAVEMDAIAILSPPER